MEVVFLITTIIAMLKWWLEKVKFKAIVYYIVDKEYTAPTKKELEQYIKLVAQKETEDFLRTKYGKNER